jgi:hypothetical protein
MFAVATASLVHLAWAVRATGGADRKVLVRP